MGIHREVLKQQPAVGYQYRVVVKTQAHAVRHAYQVRRVEIYLSIYHWTVKIP